MAERLGVWGELSVGSVFQDPQLKHWLVLDEKVDGVGGRWLLVQNKYKEQRSGPRRPDHEPVTIIEATEEEALATLAEQLGAHQVLQLADDRTVARRSVRWRMDPINTKGRGGKERIRDHIDMHHGVYVNDRWADQTNPKTTAELIAAHEEMHSDEHLTMLMPHHHPKEAT